MSDIGRIRISRIDEVGAELDCTPDTYGALCQIARFVAANFHDSSIYFSLHMTEERVQNLAHELDFFDDPPVPLDWKHVFALSRAVLMTDDVSIPGLARDVQNAIVSEFEEIDWERVRASGRL
ncbi:MAG: hypothetical protein AAFV19_21695 [Pseudomonadota bacterium]